eukprot:UN13095
MKGEEITSWDYYKLSQDKVFQKFAVKLQQAQGHPDLKDFVSIAQGGNWSGAFHVLQQDEKAP